MNIIQRAETVLVRVIVNVSPVASLCDRLLSTVGVIGFRIEGSG